jgi:hypothetical protein
MTLYYRRVVAPLRRQTLPAPDPFRTLGHWIHKTKHDGYRMAGPAPRTGLELSIRPSFFARRRISRHQPTGFIDHLKGMMMTDSMTAKMLSIAETFNAMGGCLRRN